MNLLFLGCTCIHTGVYVYTKYVDIYIYICMCIYIHVYMHVYIYACIYICIYIYIPCMYIWYSHRCRPLSWLRIPGPKGATKSEAARHKRPWRPLAGLRARGRNQMVASVSAWQSFWDPCIHVYVHMYIYIYVYMYGLWLYTRTKMYK